MKSKFSFLVLAAALSLASALPAAAGDGVLYRSNSEPETTATELLALDRPGQFPFHQRAKIRPEGSPAVGNSLLQSVAPKFSSEPWRQYFND